MYHNYTIIMTRTQEIIRRKREFLKVLFFKNMFFRNMFFRMKAKIETRTWVLVLLIAPSLSFFWHLYLPPQILAFYERKFLSVTAFSEPLNHCNTKKISPIKNWNFGYLAGCKMKAELWRNRYQKKENFGVFSQPFPFRFSVKCAILYI